jgi:hypothetical protein
MVVPRLGLPHPPLGTHAPHRGIPFFPLPLPPSRPIPSPPHVTSTPAPLLSPALLCIAAVQPPAASTLCAPSRRYPPPAASKSSPRPSTTPPPNPRHWLCRRLPNLHLCHLLHAGDGAWRPCRGPYSSSVSPPWRPRLSEVCRPPPSVAPIAHGRCCNRHLWTSRAPMPMDVVVVSSTYPVWRRRRRCGSGRTAVMRRLNKIGIPVLAA